ncbi:MAG: head-tail connector protein [Ignavibacteriales bacterium]
MTQAVSVAEAKAFLRVTDAAEDDLVSMLIDAAQARVETATGLTLDTTAAAPLRLSILMLVAHAFEHREEAEAPLGLIEPWLAPYRPVHL